jgi:pilus assembly protein Flp/PilA
MKKFFMNEEGQGMVEYGLIIALVAVVVIAAISLLGNGVSNTFNTITGKLN